MAMSHCIIKKSILTIVCAFFALVPMASCSHQDEKPTVEQSASKETTTVEVVDQVFDRSEKVIDDTKDFIGWQITKILLWIGGIVLLIGLISLLAGGRSSRGGGRARARSQRRSRRSN